MKQSIRAHYKLILLFILFAAIYIVHSVLAAYDPDLQAQYSLTRTQAMALLLTIAIPYIAIWFTALYGYIRLRMYARSIKRTRDGRGMWQLSNGVLWLILWLPINTLLGEAASFTIDRSSGLAVVAKYVSLYVGQAILLLAFYLLSEGTKKLVRLAKPRTFRWRPKLMMLLFWLGAGFYIFLVLHNPEAASGTEAHALPTWLLLDTVILPRLLGWYWGLQAIWHLYLYAKFISGKIYRLGLAYLATGLGVVIACIIALRYLSTMSSVTGGGLQVILLAIYPLLIVIGAGFLLTTRGTGELARIEQV